MYGGRGGGGVLHTTLYGRPVIDLFTKSPHLSTQGISYYIPR